MKKMTRLQALAAMTLLAFGVTGIAYADKSASTQTRLKTRLAGGAITGVTPSGETEFRTDSARGRSSLNVEVEHVNLAGTTLDIAIVHAGVTTALGTIKLNALLEGELELNTQDGKTVPAVVRGDMITVSNAGTQIMSGTF